MPHATCMQSFRTGLDVIKQGAGNYILFTCSKLRSGNNDDCNSDHPLNPHISLRPKLVHCETFYNI